MNTRAADPPRRLRVLHCPWNVAGQSAALAAGERELGLDSRCVVIQSAVDFPADESLTEPGCGQFAAELSRYRLFWRALRWADIVHFNFGQSCLVPNAFPGFSGLSLMKPWRWPRRAYARLVWLADLPILKAAGKKIFITWQGDDARQGDRSRELFEICIAREVDNSYYPPGSDEWKRRAIARFARHADGQLALNPDLLHVLPVGALFLPYASFDPASVVARPPIPEARAPLKILHAPSRRSAKGTRHVLGAVERLRQSELAFDFELVENLPRQDAIRRYAEADVVVDQLLAGWYGGLAVEAMALGKVVVAYLRAGDLKGVPADLLAALPIVHATPSTIEIVLRDLIRAPRSELAMRGAAGRAFVERWHRPCVVARLTAALYARAVGCATFATLPDTNFAARDVVEEI
jgi:hypothetical protein